MHTRLLASRTQPVPAITTMGRTTALLYSPSSSHLCCSPATNAPFLPLARQRSVMSCDTAQMGADQAVPADKQSLVCASMPLSSPTSIWIRACSSSSRDQQTSLPFRRRCIEDAPPLPLVCGGGALAPHTLPWALSSMNCVWHIGCMGSLHTSLCCAPLSVLHCTAGCCGPCVITTTTHNTNSSRCG